MPSDPFVLCLSCGRPKRPRHRHISAGERPSFCDTDCDGYEADPQPACFWPGERDEEEAWWAENKGKL